MIILIIEKNIFALEEIKTNKESMSIKIFYSPNMIANASDISPSMLKPMQVVDSWVSLYPNLIVEEPKPVTKDQLYLAHDSNYVDDILSCKAENGFNNRLQEVADALPYTSGSMLAAATEALTSKVAVAPCSGFHHAGYDSAEGFCTFNGLIVTAQVLKQKSLVNNVGIVDFDMHYGNGTDDCINYLKLNYIKHFTAGINYYNESQAEEFLNKIPSIIDSMKDCDLILYQAGADPHIQDPFGGFLTNDQLRKRDRLVFENCKKYNLPIAWNLAGGYQKPLIKVLDIHDATMQECLSVF